MLLCDSWARAQFRVQSRLRASPRLYQIYRRIRRVPSQYADSDTDIVIEGAPRSANSFAFQAFKGPQDEDVRIAHHLHAASHVVRGCSLGLPVLVLIREPGDCVVSRMAFHFEVTLREETRHPHLPVSCRDLLEDWCRFYETIWPYRQHFVVADFPSVTGEFGKVIERINDFFGTTFKPFQGGQRDVATLHEEAGYHAGPSAVREAVKPHLRDRLYGEISSDLNTVLTEARDRYLAFKEIC